MWMRLLYVYLTLAAAHLPAEILTFFAVKRYGVWIEKNKITRWIAERLGCNGTLIASHLCKLLVMSPIIVWYYDLSVMLGVPFMGVVSHVIGVTVLLWDSIHDIVEWIRYA